MAYIQSIINDTIYIIDKVLQLFIKLDNKPTFIFGVENPKTKNLR